MNISQVMGRDGYVWESEREWAKPSDHFQTEGRTVLASPHNSIERFHLSLAGYSYSGRVYRHWKSHKTPIFFLSGAFQSMDSWKKFVDFFAPERTVVLLDLPGTGEADLLPREYGLDFLAEAVRQMLNHCRLEQVHLIAASYGSPVAYRMAQLFPERIAKVVLAGVMLKIPDHMWQPTFYTIRPLEEGNMKEFALRVMKGLLCLNVEKTIKRRALVMRLMRTQIERMPFADRERYKENTLRLLHHAPLDIFNPPRVPALVFTGEHDVLTRPEDCREIAAALPNSVFTTLKEADHLFHIEQLESTLTLLHLFLNDRVMDGTPGCNAFEYFRKEPF